MSELVSAREALSKLESKPKKDPSDNSKIKTLKRQIKKLEKEEKEEKPSNVFGLQSTKKVNPKPIRFLDTERAYMKNRIDDIKADNMPLIAEEFGSTKHINETKLIRAAIRLLEERTDDEIIRAIKRIVVDEMIGK